MPELTESAGVDSISPAMCLNVRTHSNSTFGARDAAGPLDGVAMLELQHDCGFGLAFSTRCDSFAGLPTDDTAGARDVVVARAPLVAQLEADGCTFDLAFKIRRDAFARLL